MQLYILVMIQKAINDQIMKLRKIKTEKLIAKSFFEIRKSVILL